MEMSVFLFKFSLPFLVFVREFYQIDTLYDVG